MTQSPTFLETGLVSFLRTPEGAGRWPSNLRGFGTQERISTHVACHPASNSTFLLLISFHRRAFRVFRGSCCKSLKEAVRCWGRTHVQGPALPITSCVILELMRHTCLSKEAGVRSVTCLPDTAVVGSEEVPRGGHG